MSLYRVYRYFVRNFPRFKTEYFFELDISKAAVEPSANDGSFKMITKENLGLLPERHYERFSDRLDAKSDKCFAIVKGGEEYCFMWVATEGTINVTEIGMPFNINRGDAWIYHVKTGEKFRKKGIGSLLLKKVVEYLRSVNISRAVCYTNSTNIGMQTVLKKSGFTLYKKYKVFNVFGKRYSYASREVS